MAGSLTREQPIIPFSLKPWHEVGCHICNFFQDIKFRPDVTNQHGQIPMNGYGAGGPPPQGPTYASGGAGGAPEQYK